MNFNACQRRNHFFPLQVLDVFKNLLHVAKFGSEIPKRGGQRAIEGPTFTLDGGQSGGGQGGKGGGATFEDSNDDDLYS